MPYEFQNTPKLSHQYTKSTKLRKIDISTITILNKINFVSVSKVQYLPALTATTKKCNNLWSLLHIYKAVSSSSWAGLKRDSMFWCLMPPEICRNVKHPAHSLSPECNIPHNSYKYITNRLHVYYCSNK